MIVGRVVVGKWHPEESPCPSLMPLVKGFSRSSARRANRCIPSHSPDKPQSSRNSDLSTDCLFVIYAESRVLEKPE